jgi:hypothetical protein
MDDIIEGILKTQDSVFRDFRKIAAAELSCLHNDLVEPTKKDLNPIRHYKNDALLEGLMQQN